MSHEKTPRFEHDPRDDWRHETVMRAADETLRETAKARAEARARLDRAMARYAERRRG